MCVHGFRVCSLWMDHRLCRFSCPGRWRKETSCCASRSNNQTYLPCVALHLERDCALFTIPTHVLLSMCIGVGGCGCPVSRKISLILLACWALKNSAPHSASAADEATRCFMTVPRNVNVAVEDDRCAVMGHAPLKRNILLLWIACYLLLDKTCPNVRSKSCRMRKNE